MFEQCCYYSKQCRNNVATLWLCDKIVAVIPLLKYVVELVLKPFEISDTWQKLQKENWGIVKKLHFMVQEACTVVSSNQFR